MVVYMFYLGQLLGFIALLFLILSLQKNNKDKLLKYQIFANIFFIFQYLCLNAITGSFIYLVVLIRNLIFKKLKNNIPISYLLIILFLIIILSYFSYKDIFSLLPTVASIMYSFALWQKKLSITRLIEIFSCVLFIIYNIHVLAIGALISTLLEMISGFIAIYRYDIKNEK